MALSPIQRQKKRERKSRKERKKRQANSLGQPRYSVLLNGTVRMSDVVKHLAKPIVDECVETVDDLEYVISATIAAWNIALIRASGGNSRAERKIAESFAGDAESIEEFEWICKVVAERKQRFYPNLNRTILDVIFTREEGGSVWFDVISTCT